MFAKNVDFNKMCICIYSVRLYDLITVNDDRYLTAFYFGFKDTLFCEDLDTANKVAYGATRYRVVTARGQVIDISGTMTGGGHGPPASGRMGSKLKG